MKIFFKFINPYKINERNFFRYKLKAEDSASFWYDLFLKTSKISQFSFFVFFFSSDFFVCSFFVCFLLDLLCFALFSFLFSFVRFFFFLQEKSSYALDFKGQGLLTLCGK